MRAAPLTVLIACVSLLVGCASSDQRVFSRTDKNLFDLSKDAAIDTIRSYFPRSKKICETGNHGPGALVSYSPCLTQNEELVAIDGSHIVTRVFGDKLIPMGPPKLTATYVGATITTTHYTTPAKRENYSFEKEVRFAEIFTIKHYQDLVWARYKMTADYDAELEFDLTAFSADDQRAQRIFKLASALLILCPNANK